MTIFGDGKQMRAFSYIRDVAPVITECVHNNESENEVFNIGADTPYSVLELAHEVADGFGVKQNIVHLPARKEVVHAFSSHEKVKRVFGDRRCVDMRTGIRRMADWAKKVGPRKSSVYSSIEIPYNLPPAWVATESKRRDQL